MKILITHNFYQVAGGEDAVMQNEIDLLESNGKTVIKHTVDNAQIDSLFDKIATMLNVPFSYAQYSKMLMVLNTEKPDVVHVHNYFPLFSPSIFYACKKAKVPVVHTLHNYRAVCPTALLMHEGKINEQCIKGHSWWSVSKRVYRQSLIGSFALASMVEMHKFLGTWQNKVDRYISLTDFSRNKYIEAGWPANKVVVKPNFIDDPFEQKRQIDKKGGYALYVGRLSEEKGIDVLFDAWVNCEYPIKVIGDGVTNRIVSDVVELCGKKSKKEVLSLIQSSQFVVVPSICYEGFPMAIAEAFACGTPVVCSRLGSMEEIVADGLTGLHFEAGNADDLAEKIQWMIDHPLESSQMGKNARQQYLEKYSPEKNYKMLMVIYQQAISESDSRKNRQQYEINK